jgi:ankyrin repeat protein
VNRSRIDQAFAAGDLAALREELGPEFPHGDIPFPFHPVLEYAITMSPLPFVQTLLDLGLDPNYESDQGFPSLLAALSTKREDKYPLLGLLLAAGADVNQRGLNDWTPLHYAAATDDTRAIEFFAAHGADLDARTRIDDYTTPLEEAQSLGKSQAVAALKKLSGR